tara:strand:+ start:280 stop:777 length:498 start_codon:yes stop_codon:yes gene_type:complete
MSSSEVQKVLETMLKVTKGELSREEFIRFAPELFDMIAPPPEKFFSDDRHLATQELKEELQVLTDKDPKFRLDHKPYNPNTEQEWIEVFTSSPSGKKIIVIELRDCKRNKKIGKITTKGVNKNTVDAFEGWNEMDGAKTIRFQFSYTGKRITDVMEMIRQILSEE